MGVLFICFFEWISLNIMLSIYWQERGGSLGTSECEEAPEPGGVCINMLEASEDINTNCLI